MPDKDGNKYVLTYLDVLSHSLLLEPLKSLTHGEVRRAVSRCLFRSRTLPVLLRTDRGAEFRNALMEEYAALMGMRHKLSTAMRPCELGANERVHQETQKVLGFLLNDVAVCRGTGVSSFRWSSTSLITPQVLMGGLRVI